MPHDTLVRASGLALAVVYAALIGWFIGTEPRTFTEAVGGVTSGLGIYRVDEQALAAGLAFFHRDQFTEAREAFARADPARRDARTQFYVAYSFYRQGWRPTHRDDALFRLGLEALDRAVAVAPDGRIVVTGDADLKMTSAEELRAEFAAGLRHDASDLNPLRLLEGRK